MTLPSIVGGCHRSRFCFGFGGSPHISDACSRGFTLVLRLNAGFLVTCLLTLSWYQSIPRLYGDEGEALEINIDIERFSVTGYSPIGKRKTARILAGFEGRQKSIEDLRAASSALEKAIWDAGFPFYSVVLPAQTIDDGIVDLTVVAFGIDSVQVSGNRHHSEENIRRSLPILKEGTSPSTRPLRRQIAIADLNPSKKTRVFFATDQEGGLSSRVNVQDSEPQRYLAWLNDTGTEETGKNRIGFAFQHANLFDRDHTLTASYTTSVQETDDVQVYSLSYQLPLYRYGSQLSFYAVKSDVDTGVVATFFDVSGKGDFYGGEYTYALPNIGIYKQLISLAIDDKEFDNEIDFQGQPIGVDVRARPYSLRHRGRWEKGKVKIETHAGYYENIESGNLNDSVSYAATRVGATPDWSAIRYGVNGKATIADWELRGRFSGQYTDDALIPGEQFGVGGFNSVRGIDERQLSGDRGMFLGLEAETPELLENGPSVVAFVDYGKVTNALPQVGEVKDESVTSIGAGLRWKWRRTIHFSFDYGYVVSGGEPGSTSGIEDGDSRLHFQLLGQF